MKALNLKYILAAVLVAFIAFVSVGGVSASAATAYSGVLEDLRTDKNFNVDDYPQIEDDNSLKVIQIAESSANELFVYVYQPSGATKNYRATCINMALAKSEAENDTKKGWGVGEGVGSGHGGGGFRPRTVDTATTETETEAKLYNLRFLNEFKTLYKYKVLDLTVKQGSERYYDITSIYRKFDVTVDEPPASGGTVSEVAFPVGQFWKVSTTDESKKVTYDYDDVEIISIDSQTVGCRVYDSGPWSGIGAYFFAFTCDRKIDRLINASLSFTTENILIPGTGGDYSNMAGSALVFGDAIAHFRTYYEDEYAESVNGGWLGKKVRWDRIASTDEFLSLDLEFGEEEKKLISKYDWVINFYETDYVKSSGTLINPLAWLLSAITGRLDSYYDYRYEGVNDVTLLRLEFETEGQIYDVGVVSDKSSSVDIVSGVRTRSLWDYYINFCKWLESLTGVSYIFWAFLFIAIPVFILLGVLSVFFPPVKLALNMVFKGLVIAVTFPFKLIAAAVRRYQENAPKRAQRKAERLHRKDIKEQMKEEKQSLRERKTARKQAEAARKLGARSDRLSALEQRDVERAYKQRRKAKRKAEKQARKRQKMRNCKKKKKR